MKIWMISQYASTPTTGIGGRQHYLGRELALRGHAVKVIAARSHHLLKEGVDPDRLPSRERVDGYDFIRLSVPRFRHAHDNRRVLAWLRFGQQLASLHRKLGEVPDVVVYSSPSLLGYLGAERLARRVRVPLLFEVRDIWPLTLIEIGKKSPRHPFIKFLQWIEDRAYQRADRVISNLPGAVEHMVQRRMPREKFAWVPNGISITEADNPEPLPDHVARQIPQSGLRIVYAGTLGRANALETLIDAAALVSDLKDVAIIIVGQGKERALLEQNAQDLNLKNVVFVGPVAKRQVQTVLRACDACYIGWQDSQLYRFGIAANKLGDYLYSGKPIIHSFSGRSDPVAEYAAGLTVPAEDPRALADVIRRMYAMTPEQRQRLGENGRRAALEHYDYAKLAEKFEAIVHSAIVGRKSIW
jgi:glycosyltransferase involved in cell wall biosynthesis